VDVRPDVADCRSDGASVFHFNVLC
jgi:hypothetical protein